MQQDVLTEKRIPFTPEDEQAIASASTWGLIVGGTSIATGIISLLVQIPMILETEALRGFIAAPVLQAAFTVLINVWLLQASLAFRKVALTNEADQAFLLEGFRRLRAYFMIQLILIIAAVALGIMAFVFTASMLKP